MIHQEDVVAQTKSAFLSQQHGFKFVNSFPFPFSTSFKLPLVGQIDLGDIIYGLCGGMCFAALDYFYMDRHLPNYKRVDQLPTRYLLYLWNRQLDSFGLLTVPSVLEWMLRDDLDVALRTARYEVPKLRRSLDQSKPVVLALIRSKYGSSATQNHQVLATGYDFDERTRQMVIYLYDPNHPGITPTLSLNLTKPSQGIAIKQSTGEGLRGFFIIRYKPETPPLEEVFD
jgi:hypothetical protein